jgi:hypothetical protein
MVIEGLGMGNSGEAGRKSLLTKALENEKGVDQPAVIKGFYVYADQYIALLERCAYNKIHGIEPVTASEMVREALDEYLGD